LSGLTVPGMTIWESMSLYHGEDDARNDPELQNIRKNAMQTRRRREAGVQPFAVSAFRGHTPPCDQCEFASLCREKALACNIFAEWTVSRREIPAGIKKLLPSKKWMRLLQETEHLGAIRVAYFSQLAVKQTDEPDQGELI
jgi:hypothetical protein